MTRREGNKENPSSVDVHRTQQDPSADTFDHNIATNADDAEIVTTDNTCGYWLKWSTLTKTVEVKDLSSGGLLGRSSLAARPPPSPRESMLLRSETVSASTSSTPARPQMTRIGSISSSNPTKTILHAVSGHAAPGQVLACLGPSGAGKTSVLSVLSGRSTYQEGTIRINDKVLTKRELKKLQAKIAYVKQNDVFFDHLTVRDQLTYTALLRLPKWMSRTEKHMQVEMNIRQLRLEQVAQSPIMMISGGERKRVNIATELLTHPMIVLLDEPTSGLDSTSAVGLLQLLQTLAREQCKTIITSIHQPSSAMFMNSFDQLYVLSEGHVVYFGKPLASLEYLEQVGLPCPVGYNAADHWMDLLVTDNKVDNDGEKEQEYSTRLTLQNAWRSRVNDNEGDEVGYGSSDMPSTAPDHALDTETIEKYQTSWWEQFLILTHRSLKNSRSALFTWINFIKSIALGMVVGALFFQLEYTEANIYNIRSYSFSSTCYWVIESMFDSLLAFPSERDVVLKERSSGSYRLSAYMMAKTAADAPTRILIPFVYVVVSYWMVGVDKSFVSFIGAVACAVLGVLSGEAFGLFVGAAMYDMEMALAVLTVCALFLMLLGGFYVEEPPAFIAWGKYVSPYKYAFDAQTQMNMRAPLPCDGSDSLPELCPPGSEGTFVSSSDVTDAIGIQGSIAFNIGMLVFWSLFYRYLAYWCLRIKKEGERA